MKPNLIMSRFAGFHTTSSKFKTKELFYFYEVLEQLKTNICVNFQFERALRFLHDTVRFNFYDFAGVTRYLHSGLKSCGRLESDIF